MKPRFSIPTIPEAERTPLVTMLLGLIEQLAEQVQKQEVRNRSAQRRGSSAQRPEEAPALQAEQHG
jgi:hypothetical protein